MLQNTWQDENTHRNELNSRLKPGEPLYLCSNERAAQCCDNPCDHPDHHYQLSVIPVSKVPKDWSQQHETADKSYKLMSVWPKHAVVSM